MNRRVTLGAGAWVASPDWDAVTAQVPTRRVRWTTAPLTLKLIVWFFSEL